MTAAKTDEIRPGERRTLTALVKTKVRALRAEIDERHAQQLADIGVRVVRKFRDDDGRLAEVRRKLEDITKDANTQAAALFEEYADVASHRSPAYSMPWLTRREDDKEKLRGALTAAVHAQTQKAKLHLIRLEAQLLEQLAMDAIQSEAARAFVRDIPTAESLLPESKLLEIEARYGSGT